MLLKPGALNYTPAQAPKAGIVCEHPLCENKTMSPNAPRQHPASNLKEFLSRHAVSIGLLIVCGLWMWQSLMPRELFATEEDRQQVLLSVGADPSTRLIILVTDWCPACKQLEHELAERKVPHVRLDAEKDPIGQALFRRVYGVTGSNSIPKIILDRNIVSRPTLFLKLSGETER